MEATFVSGEEINCDLGVINAARVSVAKHHDVLDENDVKLLQFLGRNNHISPTFHPRLYFKIGWASLQEELYFHKRVNPAGFSWVEMNSGNNYMKGSVYGWLHALQYMPFAMARDLEGFVERQNPVTRASFSYLLPPECDRNDTYFLRIVSEEEIAQKALEQPPFYKLLSATLRVKLPLFVARQIRTSKVGFVYSDLYVESESFDYNETSRRYVNADPEFFNIAQWRVREGGKVKQGSTGVADDKAQSKWQYYQNKTEEWARGVYSLSQGDYIAPEQARVLLPQSVYTEWYCTGSLHRWAQFCQLRIDPHVQSESMECAVMIRDCLKTQFPHWAEVYNL